MSLTINQYQSVCDILSRKSVGNHIRELKSHFKKDINSVRTYERINTIADLIKILEKRDSLGPDHSANLDHIICAIALDDLEIQSIISNQNSHRAPNNNGMQRIFPPLSNDPIQRINDIIKNDIGYKWKELARALRVQEGDIDRLDSQHRGDIPEIANAILQHHLSSSSGNTELWRSTLQQALQTARRTDLSYKVDNILTQFSFKNVQ